MGADYDDYLNRCRQANVFAEMEEVREKKRMEETGVTTEMKRAAGEEVQQLYAGIADQTPEEQLRRYERMFECFGIRGYLSDPDPTFDLIRIRAIKTRMRELEKEIAVKKGTG